jgi:hypothetical protein
MDWLPRELNRVEPVYAKGIKSSGRTRPVEMYCRSETISENYIVKLASNVELGTHSLARELIAADLADIFGIPTPLPALVEIPSDFFLTVSDNDLSRSLQTSPGLNFGSTYIPDSKIFSPPILKAQIPAAVKIYCFDLLIANMDRRISKPNLFDRGDDFIIFDHEQAFPFSKPQIILGGAKPGWEYITELWHRDHCFYPSLKHENCDTEIDSFFQILQDIDSEVFDTIESRIPHDWFSADILNIRNYILDIVGNLNTFKRNLQECFYV